MEPGQISCLYPGVDGLIHHAEIVAELSGDFPDYGHVFTDEFSAVSVNDATEPPAATRFSTRLAALPWGNAASRVDSGTPSRVPSLTASASSPI
jgi:hypothetical protein